MNKDFNLSQSNYGVGNGVCFVATLDWAGSLLRGNTINSLYYNDERLRIWTPYIEQQREAEEDVKALKISGYQYVERLLKVTKDNIVPRQIGDNNLGNAIRNLAAGRALLIWFTFRKSDGTTGFHAVAFAHTSNGKKLFFDPNLGQYSGNDLTAAAADVNTLLLATYNNNYNVSMLAEFRLA